MTTGKTTGKATGKRLRKMHGGGYKRRKISILRAFACVLAAALLSGNLMSSQSLMSFAQESDPLSGTSQSFTNDQNEQPGAGAEGTETPANRTSGEDGNGGGDANTPGGTVPGSGTGDGSTPGSGTVPGTGNVPGSGEDAQTPPPEQNGQEDQVKEEEGETITAPALNEPAELHLTIKGGKYAKFKSDAEQEEGYDEATGSLAVTIENHNVNDQMSGLLKHFDVIDRSEYFAFDKWTTEPDGEGQALTAFENRMTVYAHYKLREHVYPVTFIVYDEAGNELPRGSEAEGGKWDVSNDAFYYFDGTTLRYFSSEYPVGDPARPYLSEFSINVNDGKLYERDVWYQSADVSGGSVKLSNPVTFLSPDNPGPLTFYSMLKELKLPIHQITYHIYDEEGNSLDEKWATVNSADPFNFPTSYYEGQGTPIWTEKYGDIVGRLKGTQMEPYRHYGWYTKYDAKTKKFSGPISEIPQTAKRDYVIYGQFAKIQPIEYVFIDKSGSSWRDEELLTAGITNTNPKTFTALDETFTLTPVGYIYNPDDYYFDGWYSGRTAEGMPDPATEVTVIPKGTKTPQKLYALLRRSKVTLSFAFGNCSDGQTPIATVTTNMESQYGTAPGSEFFEYVYTDDGAQVVLDTVLMQTPAGGTEAEVYRFKGWYTDEELTKPVDYNAPLYDDVTFYAKTERLVRVAFDADATGTVTGAYLSDVWCLDGEPVTLPAGLVQEGKRFLGWSEKKQGEEGAVILDGNTYTVSDHTSADPANYSAVTLYAHWADSLDKLTLKFDVNGNDGNPIDGTAQIADKTNITYGTPVSSLLQGVDPVQNPKADWYEFDVWCLDEARTIPVDPAKDCLTPQEGVTEVTFYARWKAKAFTTDMLLDYNNGLLQDYVYPDATGTYRMVLVTNLYKTLGEVEEQVFIPNKLKFGPSVTAAMKKRAAAAYASGIAHGLEVVAPSGETLTLPVRFVTVTKLNIQFESSYDGKITTSGLIVDGYKTAAYLTPVLTGGSMEEQAVELAIIDRCKPQFTFDTGACANILDSFYDSHKNEFELELFVKDKGSITKKQTGKLTVAWLVGTGTVKGIANFTVQPAPYVFTASVQNTDPATQGKIKEVPGYGFAAHTALSTALKPANKKTPTTVVLRGRLGEASEANYPLAAKLTVKSDNTKAVNPGAVLWGSAENDCNKKSRSGESDVYFSIPLTVGSPGSARITLTANDAVKTTREYLVIVYEDAVRITPVKVTLNKATTDPAQVYVTGTPFALIAAVAEGSGSTWSEPSYRIEYVKAKNRKVKADAETMKNWFAVDGTGNLELSITDAGVISSEMLTGVYELTLKDNTPAGTETKVTVTVTDTVPKITVKQERKINLKAKAADGAGKPYRDFSETPLALTAEGTTITNATVKGTDGMFVDSGQAWMVGFGGSYLAFDAYEETLYIKRNKSFNGTITDKKNHKITLELTLDGYRNPVETTFTVATENKMPQIKPDITSHTFYPTLSGGEKFTVYLMTGNKTIYSAFGEHGEAFLDDNLATYMEHVYSGYGGQQFQWKSSAHVADCSVKGNITVRLEQFEEPVRFAFTLYVKTAPKFTLSASSVKLNRLAPGDIGATVNILTDKKNVIPYNYTTFKNLTVTPVPGQKATEEQLREIDWNYSSYGNEFRPAWGTDSPTLPKGTWKYTVSFRSGNKQYSLPLSVQVTEAAPSVTLSQKGAIDLTDDASGITLQFGLKNLNGARVNRIELSGRDAGLFRYYYPFSPTAPRLTFSPGVDRHSLIRGHAYDVSVSRVEIGHNGKYRWFTLNKKLTVKPVQSTPKLTITPMSGSVSLSTSHNCSGNRIELNLKAQVKSQIVEIEEISGYRFDPASDSFTVYADTQNPNPDGSVTVKLTQMKTLPKGAHTVKLWVRYKNQAGNVNDTVVNYRITVQ